MNFRQVLSSALEYWSNISGLSFGVADSSHEWLALSGTVRASDIMKMNTVLFEGRDSEEIQDASIFTIPEFSDNDYYLVVYGPEETRNMIGQLAVCQVKTILDAYIEKDNKNTLILKLMLGIYNEGDIVSRCKKMHMTINAPRVVYLVDVGADEDGIAKSTIKNIFSGKNKDFIVVADSTHMAVVHELGVKENAESLDSLANTISDMLSMEAMIKARVSYSTIIEDLSNISGAYQEACTAMAVGQIFYADRTVFSYASLGIGRLIYQIPEDICRIFLDEVFRDETGLDDLDKETLTIIRTLFENNLNLSEAARQLYLHRNTLVYRLEKISKKYGLDIRNFEEAVTFKIAMMVRDLLQYREK